MTSKTLVAALFLATIASGRAHGQAIDLGMYQGTWLTDDKAMKIVVSPHGGGNQVDVQYFNDAGSTPSSVETSVCSRTKQADGLTCANGLWMALRSDGKLSTNEESHPPGRDAIRYVFLRNQPGP